MTNIYYLEVRKEVEIPEYDVWDSWVIIAKSPSEARKMCGQADEGDIWTNPKLTSCTKIGITRLKPQVVLGSFNAG